MKVLLDGALPFSFAHGGAQLQMQGLQRGLSANGVEVEWLRWWDPEQTGDIVHFLGRPHLDYVQQAQSKGIRVVLAELLTAVGSRPPWALATQRLLIATLRRSAFFRRMAWESYRCADACVALTAWEASLMTDVFGAERAKVHVVPNGVDDVFFETAPSPRIEWLVCTATIHQRKRVLELARAAVQAKTPVWIIGKPYAEADAYHRAFLEVARANPQWVRYEGAIDDRRRLAEIYRGARGFVLISTMESQSLSALEAAASRCPLLLSDLPWATTTFSKHATYCPDTSDPATIARHLRAFWDADHSATTPFVPLRWVEVAAKLRALYEALAKTSR